MPIPLVLLPGALGSLEGSDAVGDRLGADRRVVLIDYRAADRFAPLLARILAAADAPRFDLLGQSYGGWIAQCLAARHPEKVRRLVLSHSFALRPGDAWRFRLGSRLLAGFPKPLLRSLLLARAGKALAPVHALDPQLFERQLARLRAQLDSGLLLDILQAQQICMRESLEGQTAALDLPGGLPILIIESDNDPLLRASARRALRRRFPDALVHSFTSAGHVSALVEAERYARLVNAFLDASPPD